MASWIFNDSVTGCLFVIAIITLPVCIIATGLRFLATVRAARKITREDWFALAATAVHVVYIVMTLIILVTLRGRNPLHITTNEQLFIGKSVYATSPLFTFNQLFAKFSIIFLYLRIFGINRSYVRCIYTLAGIHIAWCIMVLPLFLFSCRPIRKAWDFSQDGTCLKYEATVAGAETVNSAVDFAMVILAVWMIRGLRMRTATKWKLYCIFALGGFAGVIGFIKIGATYSGGGAVNFTTGIWAIIQMTFSIVCCCAPTYKPILPTEGFFTYLLSRITSVRSRSRSTTSARSRRATSFGPKNPETPVESRGLRRDWEVLEGSSSQRGLAWSEATVGNSNAGALNNDGYQLRTISIRQSIDLV